jgi:hypothetical protein
MEQIRELAGNLPTLWEATTTTAADRQQIIRFLVERVEVTVEGNSDGVHVTITWVGGHQSHHQVIRPVQRYEQAADFERLMARVRELRSEGLTCAVIAEHLNAEGYRPSHRTTRFHKDIVARLLRGARNSPARKADQSILGKDEYFVRDLPGGWGSGGVRCMPGSSVVGSLTASYRGGARPVSVGPMLRNWNGFSA